MAASADMENNIDRAGGLPGARAAGLHLFFARRAARKAGIDPEHVTFGAGVPLPRLKNEDGRMRCGQVWISRGVRMWAHKGGELTIGDGTYLDDGVEVIAWEQVSIGTDCYLGIDVLIMDTDLHGVEGREPENRPVHIGDEVRIGCRAIILKGVTVGKRAIIHPGCVVTHDVAEGSEVKPVAARVIR